MRNYYRYRPLLLVSHCRSNLQVSILRKKKKKKKKNWSEHWEKFLRTDVVSRSVPHKFLIRWHRFVNPGYSLVTLETAASIATYKSRTKGGKKKKQRDKIIYIYIYMRKRFEAEIYEIERLSLLTEIPNNVHRRVRCIERSYRWGTNMKKQ